MIRTYQAILLSFLVGALAPLWACNSGSLAGGGSLTAGKKDKDQDKSDGKDKKDDTSTDASTDKGTDVPVWVNGAYLTCMPDIEQTTDELVGVLCGVDDDQGKPIKPDGTKVDWTVEDESGATTTDEYAIADTSDRYQGSFKFPPKDIAQRTIIARFNEQDAQNGKVAVTEAIPALKQGGTLAKCLGAANADVKACVSAEMTAGDTPVVQMPAAIRLFVLSQANTSMYGGLTGADKKCQDAAVQAEIGGHFLALLSDDDVHAFTRIQRKATIIDMKGDKLADSITDLFANGPKTAIRYTEKGNVTSGQVWTGSRADGSASGKNCWGWSSTDSGGSASYGIIGATDKSWFYVAGVENPCLVPAHLYCIETE